MFSSDNRLADAPAVDRTVLIIANGQLAQLVVAIGENHVRLVGGQANFGWRRTRVNWRRW